MRYTQFASPLGEILLAGDERGLARLVLLDGEASLEVDEEWQRDDDGFDAAREQVLAYLDGRRRSFSLALSPQGSDFQRQVWAALLRIPYGETRTYGELARRLGRDGAARAIGAASGANPLPLLIPCHRVVAADGMGGYSGGAALKARLLGLESPP
ncbi:methylated-DNA-[protein]-cysteine S-methyltransferase [Franzmannia pantelleriensis]|uniref:Methylated-DNA--protein-cysteine methyltransferase n=1 Tax=Franzmannia pantelleriensis TaxID=48727 RepID=A0A1G9PQ04_9GAMM|nr:methylated-DNA--[protein]-cysteine S-methyltransferase [Halomonas pantelleriensis]SDM00135.1 methylated-DNA-[protein]-cysteine S-methyltransferase [Halomonas pantelleriensis]